MKYSERPDGPYREVPESRGTHRLGMEVDAGDPVADFGKLYLLLEGSASVEANTFPEWLKVEKLPGLPGAQKYCLSLSDKHLNCKSPNIADLNFGRESLRFFVQVVDMEASATRTEISPIEALAAPVAATRASSCASTGRDHAKREDILVRHGGQESSTTSPGSASASQRHRFPGPKYVVVAVGATILFCIGAFLHVQSVKRPVAPLQGFLVNQRNISPRFSQRPPDVSSPKPKRPVKEAVVKAVPDGSSQGVTVTASSVLPPQLGNTYFPANAVDGRLGTAWCEGAEGSGTGEWIRIDFGKQTRISNLAIFPGYGKNDRLFFLNDRVGRAKISFSDGGHMEVKFADRPTSQDIPVAPTTTTYILVTVLETFKGSRYRDTCISEIQWH